MVDTTLQGIQVFINKDSLPLTSPASVSYNDSIDYQVIIVNSDSQGNSISDVFDLAIGNSLGDSSIILSNPSPVNDTLTNLGDTVHIRYSNEILDSAAARYGGGGGGIVVITIWPVARSMPQLGAADTANFVLIFPVTASVHPSWQDRKIMIASFPNPVSETLFLRYGGIEKEVEYVRIFNLAGEEVYATEKAVSKIDMTPYPVGMYFLRLEGVEGKSASFKIEKTN